MHRCWGNAQPCHFSVVSTGLWAETGHFDGYGAHGLPRERGSKGRPGGRVAIPGSAAFLSSQERHGQAIPAQLHWEHLTTGRRWCAQARDRQHNRGNPKRRCAGRAKGQTSGSFSSRSGRGMRFGDWIWAGAGKNIPQTKTPEIRISGALMRSTRRLLRPCIVPSACPRRLQVSPFPGLPVSASQVCAGDGRFQFPGLSRILQRCPPRSSRLPRIFASRHASQ